MSSTSVSDTQETAQDIVSGPGGGVAQTVLPHWPDEAFLRIQQCAFDVYEGYVRRGQTATPEQRMEVMRDVLNHALGMASLSAVSLTQPLPDGDPEIANGEWPNVDGDGEPISSPEAPAQASPEQAPYTKTLELLAEENARLRAQLHSSAQGPPKAECEYCKKWHDPRVACPEYAALSSTDSAPRSEDQS